MAEKEKILKSEEFEALLRVVVRVRLLSNPPSIQRVQDVFDGLGWERRHRDVAPSGIFYAMGNLQAAINDQQGNPFVSFQISDLGDADGSSELDSEIGVLQGVAERLLAKLAALVGHQLDDPGELYDEVAMDYVNPYYRRLGSWVLSIGLIHLGPGEPVLIASRLAHWAELVDD